MIRALGHRVCQFGLELQVVDKRSSQQSAPMFSPPNAGYHKPAAIRHEPSAGRHKVDDGNSIEFSHPQRTGGGCHRKGRGGLTRHPPGDGTCYGHFELEK